MLSHVSPSPGCTVQMPVNPGLATQQDAAGSTAAGREDIE